MIAFDTSTTAFTHSGSSLTWSHTCTGTDRFLVVFVMCSSSKSISSVTYNGVAMTAHPSSGGGQRIIPYVLANPASGANNIVVTMTSTTYIYPVASSYTGVDQTNPVDTSNQTSQSASSTTSNFTTTVDNCWAVMAARQASTGNTSASTGSTLREANAGFTQLYDTNTVLTPAGSHSMAITHSGAGTTDTNLVAIKPATAASGIAFDAATEDKTSTGTTLTYAHTCTGTDRFLYVHVTTLTTGSHTINSVTYNGVAMTPLVSNVQAYSATWKCHSYYLVNPASGTNDVVVTMASSPSASQRSGAVSYTGVDQTNPILTSNSAYTSSGGTCNVSLTTADDGWWLISGANPDAAFAAGVNTDTLRASYGGLADIADSDGDIAATTANAQMTHAGSRGGGVIGFALKKAGGGGGEPAAAKNSLFFGGGA